MSRRRRPRDGRHRHGRDDQILNLRARHRATKQLIDAHREEFNRLLSIARLEVASEFRRAQEAADALSPRDPSEPDHERPEVIDRLTTRAPEQQQEQVTVSRTVTGIARLKPGPRPPGEEVTDRLRVEVGQCPICQRFHDAGHACPTCTAPPDLITVPSEPAREATRAESNIARLYEQGKTATWIAANTGEPMRYVMRVLEDLRTGRVRA